MTVDRALGILALILGLPGFFALFLSPYHTAAIVCVILAGVILAVSLLVARIVDRPAWEYRSVKVELDLSQGGPAQATLSKTYKIVSNANDQRHLLHRNIGADGRVHSFTWNGVAIPAANISQSMGEYEVTVEFRPPRARGETFDGVLAYRLDDSFPSVLEAIEYAVDLPTGSAHLTVKLPDAKPCRAPKATLAIGGQERPLAGLKASEDGKTLTLEVSRPRLGSTVRIYWNW